MTRFLLPTMICLMLATQAGSADVSAPVSDAPAERSALVAPEFSSALDIDAAVAAFRADDAKALLAIAEKLGKAEGAAGKVHAPLPSLVLYRQAIRAAIAGHDLKSLDLIGQRIEASQHLTVANQRAFAEELDTARKIAAGVRKIDAGPGLRPRDVSAEAIAMYNTFVKEIRITQEYGTEEELSQLVDAIRLLRELHPKQRDHLKQLATTAKVAIRERNSSEDPAAQLASTSRNPDLGLRILGPAEVPLDGKVSLIVIAAGPAGRKPGEFQFRGSPGVKIADQMAWTGTPQVIPATINTAAGSYVSVRLGAAGKNGTSITWNAQTVRD